MIPEGIGGTGFQGFSESAILAMMRCHAVAKEFGTPSATDLHLLYALMSNPQISTAFRRANIDFENTFTPSNLGLEPGGESRPDVPIDQTVQDVLKAAGRIAGERNLRRITAELLALSCVTSSKAFAHYSHSMAKKRRCS